MEDLFEQERRKKIYEEIGKDVKKNLKRDSLLHFLFYLPGAILLLCIAFYVWSLRLDFSLPSFVLLLCFDVGGLLLGFFFLYRSYKKNSDKDVVQLGEENVHKSLLVKGYSQLLRKRYGTWLIGLGILGIVASIIFFFILGRNSFPPDSSYLSEEKTSAIRLVESDRRKLLIHLENEAYHLSFERPYNASFDLGRLEGELNTAGQITYQYVDTSVAEEKILMAFKTATIDFTFEDALVNFNKMNQLLTVIASTMTAAFVLMVIGGTAFYFFSKAYLDNKAKYDSKDIQESIPFGE